MNAAAHVKVAPQRVLLGELGEQGETCQRAGYTPSPYDLGEGQS